MACTFIELRNQRRKPLALWLAAVSAQAGVALTATAVGTPMTVTAVNSCNDDNSPGTLRYAVLTANEGDTIDLGSLACSRITLQLGAINIDQQSLTIAGPGASRLTIDANHGGRAFFHSGSGTITLNAMTISNGLFASDRAFGGCVYSHGSVGLTQTVVTQCRAQAQSVAGGGGAATFKNMTLIGSMLSDNVADATEGVGATTSVFGGGASVLGKLTLIDSVVSGNLAHSTAGYVRGGGAYVQNGFNGKYCAISANTAAVDSFVDNVNIGQVGGLSFGFGGHATTFTMNSCTVDHNRADVAAGLFLSGDSTDTVSIRNSTISTNIANQGGAGILVGTRLTLSNSTIAFNSGGSYGGGGVVAEGDTLKLESTIIADNSPNGSLFAADLDGSAVISGHDNLVKLIGASVTLPSLTIRLDPQLGALQDNGGPTRTHALLPGSPAIDAGNNTANLDTDQRNTNFPRVVGARADIGAFEFNSDIIFVNGFN